MSKKSLVILFLVLSFSGFSQTKEINIVLNNWHKAAAEADYESYFGLMADDAVFVGSDASEVWNLKDFKAFSKPYFDDGKAWTFVPVERNVYNGEHKTVAWFDEVLSSNHMGVCRGSGVMKKTKDGKWKVKHYVLSIAIPNSLVSQVVKQKSKLDKEYLETQP